MRGVIVLRLIGLVMGSLPRWPHVMLHGCSFQNFFSDQIRQGVPTYLSCDSPLNQRSGFHSVVSDSIDSAGLLSSGQLLLLRIIGRLDVG
jgi:hypothetical protein